MAKTWTKFPHADKAFVYAGAGPKKHWAPCIAAIANLSRRCRRARGLAPFPSGRIPQAVEAGRAAGTPATTLPTRRRTSMPPTSRSRELQARAVRGIGRLSDERSGNTEGCQRYYLYASALGRYGQGISVAKALAQGLGGKIKEAL